jgi:hypothetical protein
MRLPSHRKTGTLAGVLLVAQTVLPLAAASRPGTASGNPPSARKTRVWVFCRRPATRARRNVRQAARSHRVASPAATKSASGRPFFLNADPIGFAGGMNWYAYANGNPLIMVDPSGHIVETVWDIANIGMGAYSLQDNVRKGNWGWAALDAVGLAYDSVAAAVPFLPAGASAGFKAARAGNSVVQSVNAGLDVAQTTERVHEAARAIETTASAVPWQAALDGSQLHRQVASQSDSLRHFDATYMTGSNGAIGRRPDMIGNGIWADITTPRQGEFKDGDE